MPDEAAGQSLLDPALVERVIRHLEATDVDELDVVFGSSRLYLRREPGRLSAPLVSLRRDQAAPAGIPVVAPLTGIFWARPAPNEEPFAQVGEVVVAGQTIGLIETMKLFNEVASEIAGEVVSISVRDGDLVESGQPLLYLRPQEREKE